uniref:Immunoglobulin domain-containing protein n=1 Tax=Cyprinus carpio TaxID=7962 RepID=A0A8C1RC90_CYPCA
MQNMLLFFLFILFMDGVSGADETESVMEGDSVTLHTNLTEIQNDDTILWMFGPEDSVVSQITRKAGLTSFFVTDKERFRGRLRVDQKTGSLTIRNTRFRHSGKYKLTVSREQTTIKIFNVTVFGVVGEMDEVKSVSVMEGDPVTLQTDAEIHSDDLIVWRFGDKGILLAKIDVETKEISLNDDDERFRDRLQLNQTGSLIIKKTKTENAGFYELQIRGRESSQRFLLFVTGSWLSPGLIAGVIVAFLLVAAVLAAVVIYYRRKISILEKKKCKYYS